MCGGGLVGGRRDVLVIEIEATVEMVQIRAAEQYQWGVSGLRHYDKQT